MKLHEIAEEVRLIERMIEEDEDGTIDEESFAQALEGLNIEKADKIANLGLWVKEMQADAELLKSEEARLAKRRKTLENKQRSIKDYLAYFMDEKVQTPLVTVRKQKGRLSVAVTDEGSIPEDYRVPQPDKIDKAKIKKALQDGADVLGATMNQGNDFVVIS